MSAMSTTFSPSCIHKKPRYLLERQDVQVQAITVQLHRGTTYSIDQAQTLLLSAMTWPDFSAGAAIFFDLRKGRVVLEGCTHPRQIKLSFVLERLLRCRELEFGRTFDAHFRESAQCTCGRVIARLLPGQKLRLRAPGLRATLRSVEDRHGGGRPAYVPAPCGTGATGARAPPHKSIALHPPATHSLSPDRPLKVVGVV